MKPGKTNPNSGGKANSAAKKNRTKTATGSKLPEKLYRIIGSQPETAFIECYEIAGETQYYWLYKKYGGEDRLPKYKFKLYTSLEAAQALIWEWAQDEIVVLSHRIAALRVKRVAPLHCVPIEKLAQDIVLE